jgi:PAS domain S-box-containing protein
VYSLLLVLIVLSLLLQALATVWAARLMRVTGRMLAWGMISAGLLLMTIRRIFALSLFLSSPQSPGFDISEGIGLLISLAMCAGVFFLESYFRSSSAAQTSLRAWERVFGRVFEKWGEGNLLIDQGKFIDCNETAVRILGYASKADLIGKEPSEVSPSRQPDGMLSTEKSHTMIARGLADGHVRFEWVHRRADGTPVPMEIVLTTIELAGKTVLHTSWRDVSERKRSDLASRESRQAYDEVIRNLPSGILVFAYTPATDSFILLDGNHEAERITGIALEAWRGRDLTRMFPDAGPRGVLEHYRQVMQSGTAHRREDLTQKQGRLHTAIRVHAFRVPGSRLVVSVEDISEQKRMEEVLQSSAVRYRLLFESLTQGVVYQDADGRIVSVNPAAERMLGLTAAEMQGLSPGDPRWKFLRPDGTEFPAGEHPIAAALTTGKPVRDILTGMYLQVRDEQRWLMVNAVPLFRAGEQTPHQVCAILDDITELMSARQENTQLRAQVSGTQNADVPDVLHTDLESLLDAVVARPESPLQNAEHILASVRSGQSALTAGAGGDALNLLGRELHRVRAMVFGLLIYSRASSKEMHPVWCDMTVLAGDVARDLAPSAAGNAIRWRIDPMPPVLGDRPMLRQVYHALMSNAQSFSRLSPHPDLHAGCIADATRPIYFITDNGTGFDASAAGRLFHPFVRLHAHPAFEGVGMSLAIVRRLIRRHGGWIWAESAPGKGATFYIQFPGV